MPKRLTMTIPHALGAAEVRRRIDRHTDWAVRRLAVERIAVVAEDWSGDRRAFAADGYGFKGEAVIEIGQDSVQVGATIPWVVGVFAPAIEAVGRHYAGRLLSAEGVASSAPSSGAARG